MGIDLTVGYKKSFEVGDKAKKPDGELDKSADGFYYSLTGELKAGAYLDLVATAFYFFQKSFTLELKEWSLGEFEFSNKQSKLPEGGEGSQFKEDDLRKNVTPGEKLRAEVATMSAEKLLDIEQNKRFSEEEKKETLKVITDAEAGRKTQFNFAKQQKDNDKKAGTVGEGGESLFNDVAAQNMQFMDQYVDKHVDWDEVMKETSASGKLTAIQPSDENKAKIKKTLMVLKDKITIPASFKDHYALLVHQFEAAYTGSNSEATKNYIIYLKNKNEVLGPLHTFKVDVLHSQFWGDESQIDSNLRSWSVFGETKFEALVKQYDALYDALHKYNANKKEANPRKALKEMQDEHHKKLEEKRAKIAKENTEKVSKSVTNKT